MAPAPRSLLTVGHGALDKDALSSLLRAADVEALVDIRRYPNSRHNPDVETGAIQTWARAAHIDYRWEERLGGRRRLSTGTEREDAWWRVPQFAAYAVYTRTEGFGAALEELLAQADRQRTAIMCSEAVWWRCHRRLVADVAVLRCGVAVSHLMHDGRLVPHPPAEGARVAADGEVYWIG
ncbi:DUF488 family protein [Mycolicibacterium vaccae]|uniref:DUF488 domain-containing protein n=1 Tax=Mycolicibacterium vaccae TaxID=1810 RepID=UPI003CE81162